MSKLFGTDGIRGIAGDELDGRLAFRVGQAAALVLNRSSGHRARVLIGRDTRVSSGMLEAALTAGVTSVGADVLLLGLAPTPAVAYLTVSEGADAGFVISASHNTFEHNGIKIFGAQGYKLTDQLEYDVEALIGSPQTIPQATHDGVGRVDRDEAVVDRYISHLADTVYRDLSSLRIAVDCANGAAVRTAGALFSKVGVRYTLIHDKPDGLNINAGCGSTDMRSLGDTVSSQGFDLGLAFDGDADRCLAVDDTGRPIDGDRIMAICAFAELERGELSQGTIVATVMSNLGFHSFVRGRGLNVVTTPVGDRNVLEKLLSDGYDLGGEQSGHLIFRRHATTGDGQLTALRLLCAVKSAGLPASRMFDGFAPYPQVLVNVRVTGKNAGALAEHPDVVSEIKTAETLLGDRGRILVRPSGTEPLVRVMVEGPDETLVRTLAEDVASAISRLG